LALLELSLESLLLALLDGLESLHHLPQLIVFRCDDLSRFGELSLEHTDGLELSLQAQLKGLPLYGARNGGRGTEGEGRGVSLERE
jgi:hypothetical protein